MTGIIVKGNFPTNTIKGYVTKYYGEYDMLDAQWKPMFEVSSSDRAFELEALTDNFTVIPAKPESTNITYQSGQERFNTTYNHTSFGGGFQISKEAKDDGKELDLAIPHIILDSTIKIISTVFAVANNAIIDNKKLEPGNAASATSASGAALTPRVSHPTTLTAAIATKT